MSPVLHERERARRSGYPFDKDVADAALWLPSSKVSVVDRLVGARLPLRRSPPALAAPDPKATGPLARPRSPITTGSGEVIHSMTPVRMEPPPPKHRRPGDQSVGAKDFVERERGQDPLCPEDEFGIGG